MISTDVRKVESLKTFFPIIDDVGGGGVLTMRGKGKEGGGVRDQVCVGLFASTQMV